MILDTDVLIWFLRGKETAVTAVMDALPFSVSIVTYMELMQGMRNKQELAKMKKAFREMDVKVIPISQSISLHACEYVEEYSLSSSMELADALIAATCVESCEMLYTANDKHYKVVDGLNLKVFRP